MSSICPTITVKTLSEYNSTLEELEIFAKRVHIDFADGKFAPTKLVNVIEAHWPDYVRADFHLMLEDPLKEVESVISQHPSLVIVHAESKNAKAMIDELNSVRIKTGVAVLPDTTIESALALIELSEHVLIFGGHLGYWGGDADLTQLSKVHEVREIRPEIEIGWDGGANESNLRQIIEAGVDVVNVGGYIQKAPDAQAAYAKLEQITGRAP